jgi:hypothetical protein
MVLCEGKRTPYIPQMTPLFPIAHREIELSPLVHSIEDMAFLTDTA